MMKRLTLFLIAVGLSGSTLLVWSCSSDGAFFEANPASPFSSKTVAARNPFSGLDEAGYVKGVGSAETYRAFLQTYARRLALVLNDETARSAVMMGIEPTNKKEANLSKVLSSHPELLATMADGFLKDLDGSSFSDSKLTDIIKDYDDRKAFLSASHALFGLEITLVDKASTYKGQTPLDVFHNPVLDEKDTDHWEGFDPDGKPVNMSFSMDGFKRTDPFFYIHYDDEFFEKRENWVTTAMASPSPRMSRTFFSVIDPVFSLLVKPALAHPGHTTVPDCYHDQSIYLTRFYFTNDHEPIGSPEMVIFTTASYRRLPSPWTKVPRDKYSYYKANNENTAYPREGDIFPEINRHPGIWCKGDVIPVGANGHDKEDEITVRVVEEDFGWDFDDKVGQWRYVRTFGRSRVYLDEDHYGAYSSPQDCEVYLIHNYPGQTLYQ